MQEQNVLLEQKVEERTHELKVAQAELIHKEKFAALGKITSLLAHEIQNPLNFVNNYAELAEELSTEITNAESEDERNKLITQLNENLSKINQHGKRADGIIKNLFQHLKDGRAHELFEDKDGK